MNTPLSEDIRSRLLVARLPSPPQTLLKLLTLCQSEDASITELAALIAHDPAVSARVLAVAHSAAYQAADTPSLGLLQATHRLGTALIKVLVISETVAQTFNQFSQAGTADLRGFWKHSLSVALTAKALAQRLGTTSAEEAYLAGLLHDIGRLALLVAAPTQYQTLFYAEDEHTLCTQERLLGMSHTQVGAWLLGRWRLSGALIDSVLHHHESTRTADDTPALTGLLQLAHQLATLPPDQAQAAAPLAGIYGLGAPDLLAVAQSAASQLAQVARDLGIDISEARPPAPAATPVETPAATPAAAPVDVVQTQLAREVLDRSVLNEMAMTLIGQSSSEAALTQLRQHASALLHLEDVLVMLLRSNQQQLVPVSMNTSHSAAAQLSFEVADDAVIVECVSQRKVVFSARNSGSAMALRDILATDTIVLIPLLSARQCMGVLAAAVPAELRQHLQSQTPLLQTFGTYAGLALSRRRQVTMSSASLEAISAQEQAMGINKLAQALSKQASATGAVDLCQATSSLVQQLKDSRLVPGSIKLSCQVADRASLVRGSPAMVGLMVLTLVHHAMAHMSGPGEIVVQAGDVTYRHGSACLTLTVSSSAPGSASALQAQLFEPPAITSDLGASCLALSGVSRWIDKVAGHLSVSASASGTRFHMLLPGAKPMP